MRSTIETVFVPLLDRPIEALSAYDLAECAADYVPARPLKGKKTANGQVSRALSYLSTALDWASHRGKFTKIGADLVAFSGGKNLRGPQCSGMLLGRKDLIQKAYANSAPHNRFARIAKVGKEEIVGMLTAVELYLKRDHTAERNERHDAGPRDEETAARHHAASLRASRTDDQRAMARSRN